MIDAIIELKFVAVTIIIGALITVLAFTATGNRSNRLQLVGELDARQWEQIRTEQLCDTAEGSWAPTSPTGPPGSCTPN